MDVKIPEEEKVKDGDDVKIPEEKKVKDGDADLDVDGCSSSSSLGPDLGQKFLPQNLKTEEDGCGSSTSLGADLGQKFLPQNLKTEEDGCGSSTSLGPEIGPKFLLQNLKTEEDGCGSSTSLGPDLGQKFLPQNLKTEEDGCGSSTSLGPEIGPKFLLQNLKTEEDGCGSSTSLGPDLGQKFLPQNLKTEEDGCGSSTSLGPEIGPKFLLQNLKTEEVSSNKLEELKYFDVTTVPKEMWLEMAKYLDHGAQKCLRNTHPFLYGTFKEYKLFHDNSVVRFQNQPSSIFQKLAAATYCWSEIGLEIANGVFKEEVPNKFFERYGDRLTSLSFTNCEVDISESDDPRASQPYWLYNIVDQCPRLISLSVIGGSGFIPSSNSDDFVISSEAVWPSIRKVTIKRKRNERLNIDLTLFILSRVSKLEELSFIGFSKDAPGTKGLRKNITDSQKQKWEEEAKFIMTVVLPYVRTNSFTLRKLNLSHHLFLASKTSFIPEMIQLFRPTANDGDHQHRRTPVLEELDLTMCELLDSQLSELARSISTLKKINCCLASSKRCRHPQPTPKPEDKVLTKNLLYKSPLPETRVGRLNDLSIANSTTLDCICFVGQMKGLLHLDVSYCPNIREKRTLLNGIGPAYGPYSGKNATDKTHRPKCAVWKLQTFKFAGNQAAKLDIKTLILYNLTHLDLSFSNCIRDNKDFVHICNTFRKLEILKLSGSTGEFRLNRLKNLKRLKELRLRSCRNVEAIQLEENLFLEQLRTLDVADTQLTFQGLKNVIEKNRCLVYLDFRGCENVEVEPFDPEYYNSIKHVSIRHGVLTQKRKVKVSEVQGQSHPTKDDVVKENTIVIDNTEAMNDVPTDKDDKESFLSEIKIEDFETKILEDQLDTNIAKMEGSDPKGDNNSN